LSATADHRHAVKRRAVVLGVGNLLMGDEGVGVRCAQELERRGALPADVACIDGGTSTHELLEDLEDVGTLVIVDAAVTGKAPGTIVRLEGDSIPSAFSNKMSPHQHGINDLLAALALLDRAPRRVVLFGVEPHTMALGLDLSPVVAATMDALCVRVAAEVASVAAGKV
jgi:hydrogenase maturation protease